MGATTEDTERRIAELRGDMDATVSELERRTPGLGGPPPWDGLAGRARENVLLVPLAIAATAVAIGYAAYAAFGRWRESRKPRRRLQHRMGELRGRVERVRRDGLRVKLEPAGGGYVRVTGVRT
jgi:hypothetical protein